MQFDCFVAIFGRNCLNSFRPNRYTYNNIYGEVYLYFVVAMHEINYRCTAEAFYKTRVMFFYMLKLKKNYDAFEKKGRNS